MAYVLHPKIRERIEPKISANALASVLVHGISKLDSAVHDAKFQQSYVVSRYAEAEREICDYLARLDRAPRHLAAAAERLRTAHRQAQGDRERKIAADNRDVFDSFIALERDNRILGGLQFHRPPSRPAPLLIEGVQVTVDPDLLVHPIDVSGRVHVGGVIFRFSKGMDPEAAKTDATRDDRYEKQREIGRYTACLLAMQLDSAFNFLGSLSARHCLAVDVRFREIETVGTDRRRRFTEIRTVCRHIARAWDQIEPRPSICVK